VLQDGTFQPVGSEAMTQVDVRVISATNKDVRAEIRAGRFREDLFYRLCVVPLFIPPLRERRGDIPLLAETFFTTFLDEENRRGMRLSPEALRYLSGYDWPGNVRELQNVVRYLLVRCQDELVRPEHLPSHLLEQQSSFLHPRAQSKRPRLRLTDEAVRQALIATNDNKAETARRLGVGRATLYRYLKKRAQ